MHTKYTDSAPRWFDRLCLKIIDSVFRPMSLGSLVMILPDGHRLNYGKGHEIEAVIHIHDMRFFRRCVLFGSVGFGEAYVDGDWSTADITDVIRWMLLNHENHPTIATDRDKKSPVNWVGMINKCYGWFRQNTLRGRRRNIADHYDLNNDFFRLWLDPTMTYSAAYFQDPQQTLEEAQFAKYEVLCRKLQLRPTDHVLEIGTGWGGFAEHAAKHYGCRVTTVTISKEQYKYAKERIFRAGLTGKVDVQLKDYRHLTGSYDKVASIEMIEAVGHKYLKEYFATIHRVLKKDGLVAIQMILFPDHRYEIARRNTDWIQKHIFPGSLLPSVRSVQQAINATGTLNLHHYEDMTPSYAKTLKIWYHLFNKQIARVKKLGMDDRFVRKWNFYLCYCEAAFKMRHISVVQAVYSRPNNLNLNDPLEFALSDKDQAFIGQL